jgi:hypothetical protein
VKDKEQDGLSNSADGVFSSSLARAGDHFGAKDTDPRDATEVWATRIGRSLSLIAFVGLAWYFGHQLKWW